MAKDKNRQYKKKPKTKNKIPSSLIKPKKKKKGFDYWGVVVNIGYLFFTVLLYFSMTNYNAGYQWLFSSLLKNSYDSKAQIEELTTEQKWESKLGFDAKYMLYLKSQTPENAIILMPPPDKVKKKRDGGQFSNDSACIDNISWASYFVHPRKLVYEGIESVYREQVTHVAIVDKWGYQYAPNIPATQHQDYSVIQIN